MTPDTAATSGPRTEPLILSEQGCMDLIPPGGVGRVAFTPRRSGAPTVLPVEHAVVGEEVSFRRAVEGGSARALTGHGGLEEVTFEVDRLHSIVWEGCRIRSRKNF